ncbi:porin [Lichenihabitans psoromatis]|uniref:porin n=1 Tax=Lichenihabitans psoromatis TaxID=2528642 RepID=UPI001038457F|nr:porin [Lichenihabitans psoromatis]
MLHFGVAGSHRSLDPTGLTFSFSSRPEDYLERALVTSGTLVDADSIQRANAEALYQLGSYCLQGEYTYLDVTGRNGRADRSFQGGYVEGAWVVNGNGHPYRVATPYGADLAVLQGVKVEDGRRISRGASVYSSSRRVSAP